MTGAFRIAGDGFRVRQACERKDVDPVWHTRVPRSRNHSQQGEGK